MARRTRKEKIRTFDRLGKIEYQLSPSSLVNRENIEKNIIAGEKSLQTKKTTNTVEDAEIGKFKKDIKLSFLFAIFILALEVVIYFV